MTDARQPAAGAGICPDFEVLSCFADGELEAAHGTAVEAHLAACRRCDGLAHKLREGFGAGEPQGDGGIGGSGCAGEETLLLYASGTLPGVEALTLAAHVGGCDPCVAALGRLQRRLRVLDETAAPIPPAVQRRAAAVLPDALRDLAPAAPARPQPQMARSAPSLGVRARAWLRPQILVPSAVAAAALFVVAIGQRPGAPPSGGERSRALPSRQVSLRVTVAEAPVHQRPSGQSEVIATVQRGTVISVAGEERGWYEVRLEGGTPGWVVREAFE